MTARWRATLETTARRAVGRIAGRALQRSGAFAGQRAALLSRLGVATALDVGANIGQWAAQVRLYGFRGDIYSFEPLGDAYRELAVHAASDPRWHTRHVGLGREAATATLHVSANSQSSSVLTMLPRHIEGAPESVVIRDEQIELVTLASVLTGLTRPCFVKIDAQGSERAILEGCDDLAGVAGLELELSLVPLYEGETLFADMISWLRSRGFELCALGAGVRDRTSGAMLQVDALFKTVS